jgi:predicted RNase H-like HicB family nuclease
MKKLIYPALFHREDSSYWVEFPDLEGCQSFGDTLGEIYENAKEALAAYCVTLLEQGRKLNSPTDIYSIQVDENTFVSLVEADLIRKSRAVKKTLTIPSWLNEAAENQRINFSGVLQDALMQKLALINISNQQ